MKFPIPDAALAQHTAILGKTGSGKTTTAKGAVEHLVAQGARVCILDPIKSDWWGLTSSADGKKPGLPFHILGGPRGHVPLHATSGKAIAEIVAKGDLPLSILDMADFPAGGLARFFIDFAPALLRNMRGVVHLVLEEAHEFAPKERSGIGDENMLVHHVKRLATAGRSRGIRLIVLTQRTQALHNAVIGSCDTMVAHRLTAPADQRPVIDWLKANAPKDVAGEIADNLAKVKTGEGWLCSGEMGLFELVKFPRIKTYDNSATPTADSVAPDKVKTAPVDVEALRAIVGEAAKEAAANDPKALKAEVARLTAELAKASRNPSNETAKSNMVDLRAHNAEVDAAYKTGWDTGWTAGCSRGFEDGVKHASGALQAMLTREGREGLWHSYAPPPSQYKAAVKAITPSSPPSVIKVGDRVTGAIQGKIVAVSGELGAERKPLASLASVFPAGMTEAQWAVATGIKRTGGTWAAYKSRLKSAGRIEQRGDLFFITSQGLADLGTNFEPIPPPGQARVDFWKSKLPGAGPMLQVLAENYPLKLTREDLAENLNLAAGGGTFSAYLSRLKSPGLIEVDREGVRASDALMVS